MLVASDLPLYAAVRRAEIVGRMTGSMERRWNGDVLTRNCQAAVLARLWSATWQVVSPNRLRREVRRSNDRSRRRPWSKQELPGVASLFLQRAPRSPYLYAGELRNLPYGGHGVAAGGNKFHKAWTDFEVRPPIREDLWTELQFHSLHIDGEQFELRGRVMIGAPELVDALEPALRRQRVTLSVHDRVRGTLTYAKRGERGHLIYKRDESVKRARTLHPGQGRDALFIFWEYGELSPFVRWRSRASPNR